MISERVETLKSLRAGPLVLSRLVRGLGEPEVRARQAPGEWALVEVVAHLADTEERSLARTRRMLAEDVPFLPAYDPAALALERGYIQMDLAAELRRFTDLRSEQLAVLEGLDDDGWQRNGRHEEHGLITVEQLAAHTAGEDADHFAQIARLIAMESDQ